MMSELSRYIDKSDMEELLSILMISTLEEQQSDSLDFHDVSVRTLDDALTHVYLLGAKHTVTQKGSVGV